MLIHIGDLQKSTMKKLNHSPDCEEVIFAFRFRSTYALNKEQIKIKEIVVSKVICEERDELERKFLRILESSNKVKLLAEL